MNDETERPSTNQSPAWMQGALITAVSTSLILFVALIQRYLQRFTPQQVEQDTTQSPSSQQPVQQSNPIQIDPQSFTISDHDYNPDYDYRISSPPWSRYTKIVAALILLILAVVTAQRFQSLIGQIVIAAIFSYLLNPIINWMDRQTRISRNTILVITYLVLAIFVIWILSALGVTIVRETRSLMENAPTIQQEVTEWAQGVQATIDGNETLKSVLGDDFDILRTAEEQLDGLVTLIGEQGPQALGGFFASTVTVAGNTLFIFILSIYIAIEIPKLGGYVGDFAQAPGYRRDAERLTRETSRIWSAYLRGQITLGIAMFFIVWIALGILGVENAFALGLLSGFLEFVPLIGPLIGTVAAIVVAFLQTDHCQSIIRLLGEDSYCQGEYWQFIFVAIVLVVMLAIQQYENSILVPRIVGDALDLHPLLVMVSVFMGGSLAGILGAILAAPVAASLKLYGIYVWRKMFDDYPFQRPEPDPNAPPEPDTSIVGRMQGFLANLRPQR